MLLPAGGLKKAKGNGINESLCGGLCLCRSLLLFLVSVSGSARLLPLHIKFISAKHGLPVQHFVHHALPHLVDQLYLLCEVGMVFIQLLKIAEHFLKIGFILRDRDIGVV